MSNDNGMMVRASEQTTTAAPATRAFEPRDLSEGYQLAKMLLASGLFRSIQTPEAAFVIMATGRELGLTAMQSLRSIHVIDGKPSLSADLIAALCKSRGDVCQYFRLVESTDKVARYETHRVGEPAPTAMAFTIEDAQRANVASRDNWKKYPAAMLRARCITALARSVYPDLTMGVYDTDELAPAPAKAGNYVHVEEPRAEEVETTTAEPGTQSDTLSARIDTAACASELNAIARDIVRANERGEVGPAVFDVLKNKVVAKREALSAAVAA